MSIDAKRMTESELSAAVLTSSVNSLKKIQQNRSLKKGELLGDSIDIYASAPP